MNVLDLVTSCQTIGISGHENPDGDCVGSCMGMALFLRKKLPDARIDVFLEKLPPELEKNIPGTETICHTFETDVDRYDAFILLDTTPDRAGEAGAMFERAGVKINIDHHISNPGCGDHNYVDGQCGSACELVYDCIPEEDLDAQIAQALYVGIVTDTGMFRFPSTQQSTMEKAGKLISYGFDFPTIVREVYFERTYLQMKVLGEVFRRAKRSANGLLIISVMDHDTLTALGASREDLDGASEQMVQTAGVDCAIFAHEDEKGLWRCSMRSNKFINVSEIAVKIGGGGHIRASGCTVRTDDFRNVLHLIEEMVHAQIQKAE